MMLDGMPGDGVTQMAAAYSLTPSVKNTFLDFLCHQEGCEGERRVKPAGRPISCPPVTRARRAAQEVPCAAPALEESACMPTTAEPRKGWPGAANTAAKCLLQFLIPSSNDTTKSGSDTVKSTPAKYEYDVSINGNGVEPPATLCQTRTPLRSKAKAFVPGKASELSQGKTTVMMRNIPYSYTRSKLTALLDSIGFTQQYDFLYVPIDFKSKQNFGYAFVNLTSIENTCRFCDVFEGFAAWPSSQTAKVCTLSWSESQGFKANVERYRNSSIMANDIEDSYKPAIFHCGLQARFPPPTRKLRQPPQRKSVRRRAAESA